MQTRSFIKCFGCVAALGLLPLAVQAQQADTIPSTVSAPAADHLATLLAQPAPAQLPDPDQIAQWSAVQDQIETLYLPGYQAAFDAFGVSVEEISLNGVPALSVTPADWTDDGKVAVYLHGGGYTILSAKSTLPASAAIASGADLRVVAIDYSLAPQVKWQGILEESATAVRALTETGYNMSDIAIYGDSAGGALAAATALKLRNEGDGLPAAVALWSPWSEIDVTKGDTYYTLGDHDPMIRIEEALAPMALAYADPEDFSHPYVSPVYGDYSKGYAPTLIQGGTREMFLSNFVRHYQVLDQAGVDVALDLYEGMPHVFQYTALHTPEAQRALAKTAAFLRNHLDKN